MRHVVVLFAALLAGCGGGEGKPLEEGRSVEERRAAKPSPYDVSFWEPLVADGVRELAATVAKRGTAKQPLVFVQRPTNKCAGSVDMEGLRERLLANLRSSGRFQTTDEQIDAEMVLRSEISETVQVAERVRTRDCTLTLHLLNASDSGSVGMSRPRMRIQDELPERKARD